jgi:hypothetical protein
VLKKYLEKSSKICLILFSVILICSQNLNAGDTRLLAMGEMTWAVPDIEAQINLYRVAGNTAWLKANDSLNWMYYTADSRNNWGSLKRKWDAQKNQFHYFCFSGQKHLGDTQIFYGEIRYNWDYRHDITNAIEKNPYSGDPFVLADYTKGGITYHGPEVFAAFNHLILPSLWWGVSLQYNINNGLKDIETEPEIMCREINASFDLIYKLNSSSTFGLSVKPYQIQDITKLVKQKDGQSPTTKRYRGEFEYREKTSKSDRTAVYEGYEIRPQLAFNNNYFENITFFSYYYQWHKLYDGSTTRHYDGYYQAQRYGFHSITLVNSNNKYNSKLLLEYHFKYADDWAKEPLADLMFYRAFDNLHKIILGGSSNIINYPLLAALEIHLLHRYPRQNDYIASKNRNGAITDFDIRSGIEYHAAPNFDIRAGYIYRDYCENEIWNHFGDFSGSYVTLGAGLRFDKFELDASGNFGIVTGGADAVNSGKSRTGLNLLIRLKQYL